MPIFLENGKEIFHVPGVDPVGRTHDHQPLNGVAQLTDVSGPRELLQPPDRRGGELLHAKLILPADRLAKMPDQLGDILPSLPQRLAADRNDVQPEEQILPELPLADRRLQIVVCRRQDSHIDRQGAGGADRLHLAVLQHPEYLGLGPRAHVADLVQEDRAAVSLNEFSDLACGGPGKRPLLVPEQLALDQLLGDRRAVHLNKGLPLSLAETMDLPGHQLLAHAALSGDQNGRAGRSGPGDSFAERDHGWAVADDLELLFDPAAKLPVLLGKPSL